MLPIEELTIMATGGCISALLTMIAYFLRLLVQDVRNLKKDQSELRELCIWLKAEQGNLRKCLENEFYTSPSLPRKRKSRAKENSG